MSQDNEHIDLEYRPRASFFPLSAEKLLADIPRMNPGFGQNHSHKGRPRQLRAEFSWIFCLAHLNDDLAARRYPCFP